VNTDVALSVGHLDICTVAYSCVPKNMWLHFL